MEANPPNHKTEASKIFWKYSWMILSALMNAISLINIGRDLKIVLIRWGDFFLQSFKFIREIATTLLRPFSVIFGWFHLTIPDNVKDVFVLGFLFTSVYMRSIKEKDYYFKKTLRSNRQSELYKTVVYTFTSVAVGFLFGVLIALLSWIIFTILGKVFYIIYILFILYVYSAFAFVKAKDPMKAYQYKMYREYLIIVLIFVVIICLLNYFTNTFGSSN